MRKINLVVIHCSATPPSMNIGKSVIDKWHRAKGFFGCGYHYVIKRNGKVEIGRPEETIGAHTQGYNERSIGICIVGGISEEKGNPECNYTDEQWETLKTLATDLQKRYPGIKFIGHNQVANKACPCFNVPKWVKAGMVKATENKI